MKAHASPLPIHVRSSPNKRTWAWLRRSLGRSQYAQHIEHRLPAVEIERMSLAQGAPDLLMRPCERRALARDRRAARKIRDMGQQQLGKDHEILAHGTPLQSIG